MSTATRARPRSSNGSSAKAPDMGDAIERYEKARAFHAAAKRKITRINADETLNRQNRMYAVKKIKGDAFDHIGLILAGKDAE